MKTTRSESSRPNAFNRRESGMNTIEMLCFVLIIGTAMFGGGYGYKHFGVWGAIVGVPIGGVLGFIGALLASSILAIIHNRLLEDGEKNQKRKNRKINKARKSRTVDT